MEQLLKQYYVYKEELLTNYYKYDFPYDNVLFNELINFLQINIELFYYLINDEQLKIWNMKGKFTYVDKCRKIIGMLVYNNDNYEPEQIKKTYINKNIEKPKLIVKYINNNNLPVFFHNK